MIPQEGERPINQTEASQFIVGSDDAYSFELLSMIALRHLGYPVAFERVNYGSLPDSFKKEVDEEIDGDRWIILSFPEKLWWFIDPMEPGFPQLAQLVQDPIDNAVLTAINDLGLGHAVHPSGNVIAPYIVEKGSDEVIALLERIFMAAYAKELPEVTKLLTGKETRRTYSEEYVKNFLRAGEYYTSLKEEDARPITPEEVVGILTGIYKKAEQNSPELMALKNTSPPGQGEKENV